MRGLLLLSLFSLPLVASTIAGGSSIPSYDRFLPCNFPGANCYAFSKHWNGDFGIPAYRTDANGYTWQFQPAGSASNVHGEVIGEEWWVNGCCGSANLIYWDEGVSQVMLRSYDEPFGAKDINNNGLYVFKLYNYQLTPAPFSPAQTPLYIGSGGRLDRLDNHLNSAAVRRSLGSAFDGYDLYAALQDGFPLIDDSNRVLGDLFYFRGGPDPNGGWIHGVFVPSPEPQTFAFICAGLLVIGVLRWRSSERNV